MVDEMRKRTEGSGHTLCWGDDFPLDVAAAAAAVSVTTIVLHGGGFAIRSQGVRDNKQCLQSLYGGTRKSVKPITVGVSIMRGSRTTYNNENDNTIITTTMYSCPGATPGLLLHPSAVHSSPPPFTSVVCFESFRTPFLYALRRLLLADSRGVKAVRRPVTR